MNKLMLYTLFFVGFFMMSNTVSAQKFGYLNSQALLAEMPEVKQARANLETFQKQLQKKGEGMLTELQGKYQNAQQKAERGELSPKEQEVELQKLKQQEAEIGKFEQDMIRQIQEKEGVLLGPILEKVNNAIKAVAEENGYQFVFDASTQVLLYADQTTDVSEMVKSKLGL